MSKEFWMEKGSGHVNDEVEAFSNAGQIGPKRPHQWLVDTAETELYPSKKQGLQNLDCKPTSDMLYPPINPWENTLSLHSMSNQFMDRLFGNDTQSSIDFAERNLSSVGTDNEIECRKENDNQFNEGLSVGQTLSHVAEGPETCLGYGGFRKVKVNQVKEYEADITSSRESGSNNTLSSGQPYNRENDTSFVSMGQTYYKDLDGMGLADHDANIDNARINLDASNYNGGDENTISIVDNFDKVDTNIISFDGFPDEQDIIPVGRPLGSYDQICQPTSVISDSACEKEIEALNTVTVLNSSHAVKNRTSSVSKNNPEPKITRKRAPNSFPSNVRSLISTGMLDGVPVKYVSLGREELRGVIKGSGYLCGCQSCNYAKVLNAYEFERHANCKTKHPNNHVYFENGKTIYQIVQELRNTPSSLLFDTIQTVFGAPINQKSFRVWKESFQAATRELQRIYGNEELNL